MSTELVDCPTCDGEGVLYVDPSERPAASPTDLEACALWLESLASPALAGDPFILATDWAAKLVRQYAAGER